MGLEKEKELEEEKQRIEAMKQEIPKRQEAEDKELEEKTIAIRPYETIKIHDLANMFPFNITPALIESKIQHALAAKHRMQEMARNFIIFTLILMFGGVIAGYVAYKLFGGTGTEAQEVKVVIDYAGNLIGTSTGNLTG